MKESVCYCFYVLQIYIVLFKYCIFRQVQSFTLAVCEIGRVCELERFVISFYKVSLHLAFKRNIASHSSLQFMRTMSFFGSLCLCYVLSAVLLFHLMLCTPPLVSALIQYSSASVHGPFSQAAPFPEAPCK